MDLVAVAAAKMFVPTICISSLVLSVKVFADTCIFKISERGIRHDAWEKSRKLGEGKVQRWPARRSATSMLCYPHRTLTPSNVCHRDSVVWIKWTKIGCWEIKQEAPLSPRDSAMRRVSWNLANCHATVQKLLYDKSWTNRSSEVGGLRWADV